MKIKRIKSLKIKSIINKENFKDCQFFCELRLERGGFIGAIEPSANRHYMRLHIPVYVFENAFQSPKSTFNEKLDGIVRSTDSNGRLLRKEESCTIDSDLITEYLLFDDEMRKWYCGELYENVLETSYNIRMRKEKESEEKVEDSAE